MILPLGGFCLPKNLDKNIKYCYTYDTLGRVTKRTVKNHCNETLSEEAFNYDAAGNVTSAPDSSLQYDTNNRLISFNGNSVSYDLDGNMLSNGSLSCTYDSANRLITAGGHTYTYNAEDVRIRNLCAEEDTTYTYDTNCRLSKLLCKTTNGVTTKYLYGVGLIGEEVNNAFKTYHFDSRGSTIAITDASGTITDTFAYDTYGKLISRTGTSKVIFGYNGRDGVVTDDNGLIYMRARYYSPEMKRFINADIIAGSIDNAVTLNRFAYANGNPVSYVDPFGLSPDERSEIALDYVNNNNHIMYDLATSYGINYTDSWEKGYVLFDKYGISVNLSIEASLTAAINNKDAPYNTDISISSGEMNHKISSPEKTYFGDFFGIQKSYSYNKKEIGLSTSTRVANWSYSEEFSLGAKSTKEIYAITYQPEDINAVTMSLKLEIEVEHKTRLNAAILALFAVITVVASPYVGPAISTAAASLGTSSTVTGALANASA